MAPDERKLVHQHQHVHLHQHHQHHQHQHHQEAASAATALESVDNIWFQSSDLTETNFCKQYVSLPLSFDLSGLCVKRILSSQKRSLEPNFHDLEYSVVLWLEQNVELLYIYVVYGVLCIVYWYCIYVLWSEQSVEPLARSENWSCVVIFLLSPKFSPITIPPQIGLSV